jgi:non-ribosomal peptide synthetase-like protein
VNTPDAGKVFNDRSAYRNGPSLLHEYFERQVVRRLDRIAVECDGESMTYLELNEEANHIARLLRRRGVRRGSLVGLFLKKSCRLYAALLGILKAGAGYVPIDTKFPAGRVRAIFDDAGVAIVLSAGALAESLASHVSAEIIDLETAPRNDAVASDAPAVTMPSDVCYVIYTSGSTGTPKGVVVEHRNAVNFVRAMRKDYGLTGKDRVYQGFSIAFDAAVEEVWAAFALGGTLVVPTDDVAVSTQDAADFINARGVTVFSTVPSFLALMEPDLPSVRLLIVGGEACQSGLVRRWARPGRRMLNTYGPTEATVVATTAVCLPDEPVLIGEPLSGYEIYVLDENRLPVKAGECGELYIGGASVARGYLNRPNLTAEKFIADPFGESGRLYRTHDLVRMNKDGQLEFVGRADGQVKVRGFRIELSEIEAVLMEHPAIRLAAANVVHADTTPEIAAYVVLADGVAELERGDVCELIRNRVPDYMVPKYLDVLDELPTAVSGKVDRKQLPAPHSLLTNSKRDVVPPQTPLQRALVEAWERALLVSPISIRDDFFTDLHGHSLAAAKLVTQLRESLQTVRISVRDFYQHRTIESLAEYLRGVGVSAGMQAATETDAQIAQVGAGRPAPVQPRLPRMRWLCGLLQLVGLVGYYSVASYPIVLSIVLILKVLDGEVSWQVAAGLMTFLGFAVWPSWLLVSIALKWIVIGRYKPGRYPVWGFYYFRWWLVSRFQALSWSHMFVGTPLMSMYYRLMGAKVGKNCVIGTSLCVAFDLVDIGANASIGTDTHVLGYRVEDGWLILGNVAVGRDSFIGTHCCLGLNVKMDDETRLDDLSLLADGTVMAKGESRRGSPATLAAVGVPRAQRKQPRRGSNILFGLIHLGLIYAMGYLLMLSLAPAAALIGYALYLRGPMTGIAVAFATVPVSIFWYLQLVILVKKICIGRIFPGTYSLHSADYVRFWFLRYLLDNTRHIVLPLYATVFLPRFLRQLGAKIGRMVEISTIMHAMPDLLEIGDGSFLADACIVGSQRIFHGVIEIRPNKIGKRTFVGNSALVPSGVDLGDNGLVGVMSTPPAGVRRLPNGTRWLGSPGFELPAIEQASCCFSAGRTFEPSFLLKTARGLVEALRILLPGAIAMGNVVLFCGAVVMLYRSRPLQDVFLLAPVAAFLLSLISLVSVAVLKQVFIGKFIPTLKPLWSGYVWFNEVVNALYETVAATALEPLLGTPFASSFFRLMGCKIGRWVFLESTLMSEFDLVRIGDRAALNLGCTIQPHLFEDRIMKADTITIGSGCSVGNMAVVLYSTEMRQGSSLGPLSVLMKGEGLPEVSRWYGIPTQPDSIAA